MRFAWMRLTNNSKLNFSQIGSDQLSDLTSLRNID